MQALLAAVPFAMLTVMLWTAWRVLEVLRGVMIPARIRHLQPMAEGNTIELLLETREPDGARGEARLELPDGQRLRPGQRVTLWRGPRLTIAWCSHATFSAVVLAGTALLWLGLYL